MNPCHYCGKPASIYLTQIINGKITDLALCTDCAKKQGLFDPKKLSIAEQFLPSVLSSEVEEFIEKMLESTYGNEGEEKLISSLPDMLAECPACHYPITAYRTTGMLGCPECYRAFAPELLPLAVNAPGGEDELPPDQVLEPDYLESPELERGRLELLLHEAIRNENYEEAATLRDRIKSLTQESPSPTPPHEK